MIVAGGRWKAALVALALLAACSSGDPNLMRLKPAGEGPDEFSAIPSKPLEMPPSLAALPAPTPGGQNRADINPMADAVIALGGNPSARTGTPPASDGGLVTYASRYGVSPNIRQVLAKEDYDYRSANQGKLLERWFGLNTYYGAYSQFSLDPWAEMQRWRKVNAATPSAPPSPEFVVQ
jgi:hypothetical protein